MRYIVRFIDAQGVIRWDVYEKVLSDALQTGKLVHEGTPTSTILILDRHKQQGRGMRLVAYYGTYRPD